MRDVELIIRLRDMQEPIQVSHVMRRAKVDSYAYAFATDEGIIKYGESSDASSTPGERIYRQAAHLPGWVKRPRSSSGSDMQILADEFHTKYKRVLHKDTVDILVYRADGKFDALDLERDLINEIMLRCGRAPMGNKDPKTQKKQTVLNNQVRLNELFDFS
jgi:hypothetical protein